MLNPNLTKPRAQKGRRKLGPGAPPSLPPRRRSLYSMPLLSFSQPKAHLCTMNTCSSPTVSSLHCAAAHGHEGLAGTAIDIHVVRLTKMFPRLQTLIDPPDTASCYERCA